MMICVFKNKQFFKVHFNLRDLKRKKRLPRLLITQKEFKRNISSLQNKLLNLSYSLSETGCGPEAQLLFLSAQNTSQSFQARDIVSKGTLPMPESSNANNLLTLQCERLFVHVLCFSRSQLMKSQWENVFISLTSQHCKMKPFNNACSYA